MILGVIIVFLAACIGGTILWAVYEHIFALFPSAMEHGILAETIGWWDAVCVTWIFAILVKGTPAAAKQSSS